MIGLAEAIEALRAELTAALDRGADNPVRFRAGEVTLHFHVGVTRDGSDSSNLKFWVVELAKSSGFATESIQQVTVSLLPVDGDGNVLQLGGDF